MSGGGVTASGRGPGQGTAGEGAAPGLPAGSEVVVGADGRSSAVRRQLGFPLEKDPPHHFFSGLLVDGAYTPGPYNVSGLQPPHLEPIR